MVRVIKVQEVDMMGYSGDTKYFTSLKKAKRYFKKLFNRNKADIVSADEGDSEKPVFYRNIKSTKELKGRRYKEVCLECLTESTSENGTEYDTEIITVLLEEIKIEEMESEDVSCNDVPEERKEEILKEYAEDIYEEFMQIDRFEKGITLKDVADILQIESGVE